MITVQYLNGSSQHNFNITSWNTIQNIQFLPLKFHKSHSTFQLPQHPYDLLRMNEFIQLALSNYNRTITTTNDSNTDVNTNTNTSNDNTNVNNKRRKNSSSSSSNQHQQQQYILTYQNVLKFWNTIIQKSEKGFIVDDHPLIHPTFIRDQYNNTVAMLLAQKGLCIPSWWKHDNDLTNIFGDTVALIYARCGFIPPYEWCYEQTDEQYKKFSIKQRYNKVCLQNHIDKRTCMMLYILYYLKSQKYITQEDIIQLYNQLPAYCRHSSSFKDFNGQTIAHMLASYGIVPPRMFKHNPNISDKFLNSVSTYLIQKQVHVPKEWIAKTNQRYTSEFNTQAMLYITSNSVIPIISSPKHCFYHDPSVQNGEGMTVAMLYASKGINPPDCWRHDCSIKNKYGLTVYDILKQHTKDENSIPIYWRHIQLPMTSPTVNDLPLNSIHSQHSTQKLSSTKKLSLLDYPTSLHPIQLQPIQLYPTSQNEEGFEPLQTPTTNMSGGLYSSMCSYQSSTHMDEQYNKVIKRYQNINEVINTSSYNDYSRHLINSSPKQHSIQEYTKRQSIQQQHKRQSKQEHSKSQSIQEHSNQEQYLKAQNILNYINNNSNITSQKRK